MILQQLDRFILTAPHPRILLKNKFLNQLVEPSFIEMYERVLKRTQYAPPDTLYRLQCNRLIKLINSARKFVPFYREYFCNFKSLNDFSSLPPISKEEMRHAIENGLAKNKKLNQYRLSKQTSGSTGVQLKFFYDANILPKRLARYRRMYNWMNRAANDTVICLMPTDDYGGELNVPGIKDESIFFQCRGTEELEQKINGLYHLMNGKRVIIYTRPSYLFRLARLIRRDGKKFDLKGFITVAENLRPEIRNFIEKELIAPIFNFYASHEASGIGFECQYHNGFHAQSEMIYLEIVDKNGRPLPPGQIGDMLITVFDNELMPFIRYRMGDKGYWLDEPCLCGRTLPRFNVVGRDSFDFILPDGKTGFFSQLAKPIYQRIDKIFRFQVIRYSIADFELKIVPTLLFSAADKNEILSCFQQYLGPYAKINFEIVDNIESAASGKEHSFINLSPEKIA